MKNRIFRTLKIAQQIVILYPKFWLATTAVVAAVAVGLLWSREDKIDASKAAQEIVVLSENIRRYYQSKPDFWGLSTATVVGQRIAPASMLRQRKIIGAWNNEVLVGKGANGEVLMPGARGFDVVSKNLNKQQCESLATFGFEEKFWLGVSGVTLGTEKGTKYFSWNEKENILPITFKNAKSFCDKNNFIIWHFE